MAWLPHIPIGLHTGIIINPYQIYVTILNDDEHDDLDLNLSDTDSQALPHYIVIAHCHHTYVHASLMHSCLVHCHYCKAALLYILAAPSSHTFTVHI